MTRDYEKEREQVLTDPGYTTLPNYNLSKERDRIRAMTDEEWLREQIRGLEDRARQLRGCSYLGGLSPSGSALTEEMRLRSILRRLEAQREAGDDA